MAIAKEFRISFKLKSSHWEAFIINKVSSSYWIIRNLLAGLEPMGQERIPRVVALLIIYWRSSVAWTKRRGQRGPPLYNSSSVDKLLHCSPIEKNGVHSRLQNEIDPSTPFWRKPKSVDHVKDSIMLNRIKSFLKTSFKITISFFKWWHWWMNSHTQARQSWIVLFLMKLYWFLCTILRITSCNIFTSSLVMSLMIELRREIDI